MDLVIEAKILLLMFIWPAGQAEAKPLWTNEVYATVEGCEKGASQLKFLIEMEYGPDVRVVHHCFDADDRIGK